jgi:predicted component of type VI protein secretion system
MNIVRSKPALVAAVFACALLSGCQSSKPSPIDELSLQEGLQRVDSKVADAVFRRPDARMGTYSKVLLRPITVQFAKNWDPGKSGSALYDMHEPDREKIKTELGDVFVEVFRRELEKGGYPIVAEAAPDVVELQAAIVNLYITAPDVSMDVAGRSRVYTSDAGHMTLIMQLHDSVTGQLLARAYDHRNADNATWQFTNSVTNTAEAKQMIATWAKALVKAFDASRADGVQPAASTASTGEP